MALGRALPLALGVLAAAGSFGACGGDGEPNVYCIDESGNIGVDPCRKPCDEQCGIVRDSICDLTGCIQLCEVERAAPPADCRVAFQFWRCLAPGGPTGSIDCNAPGAPTFAPFSTPFPRPSFTPFSSPLLPPTKCKEQCEEVLANVCEPDVCEAACNGESERWSEGCQTAMFELWRCIARGLAGGGRVGGVECSAPGVLSFLPPPGTCTAEVARANSDCPQIALPTDAGFAQSVGIDAMPASEPAFDASDGR